MNHTGWVALTAMVVMSAGCGDAKRSVTVELTTASLEMIDPYQGNAGLARVRVSVDGPDSGDDATKDLTLDQRSVTFDDIPDGVTLEARAEGLDEVGNVVAFGRARGIDEEGDVSVSFALRRNLAYLTHFEDEEAMNPERQIYLLDVATRAFVGKVGLPGGAVKGRGVTTRDGDSVLVTYEDGDFGRLGILDADDHTWKTIELPAIQDLALGVASSPVAVVAGGNVISFVDVEQGTFLDKFPMPVGGRVLDGAISGNGRNAIFIVDVEPGGVLVNLEARTVKSLNVTNGPAGVAVRADGLVAYVTSSRVPDVVAIELSNDRSNAFGGFKSTAGRAAYSEANNAVMALRSLGSGNAQVVTWFFEDDSALDPEDGQRTLINPLDIVADGSGRRILIVASGDEFSPPGLTLLDTRPGELPVGSNALYPTDPDDTYMEPMSEVILNRRYRPRSVGILYGR